MIQEQWVVQDQKLEPALTPSILPKHRAYHSWQLVFRNPADFTPEFRRISGVKSSGFHLWNLADFRCEIYTKSARFHLKSTGFHEIRTKSAGFHEIKNVSFCVMIKYRSFFRKTKHTVWKAITHFLHSLLLNASLACSWHGWDLRRVQSRRLTIHTW